ncbi:response regulator transcription factor [candidate division KSB1 bacterium]|nr:response regulator transcription factor [candidate division KSB1 bacterium]
MKPTKKIKILFADDHSVVRDGLRALFSSSPRFHIVGEAADGEQALRLAAKKRPEVLLLDITMPKVNGIEATRLIKQSQPHTKVLILTVHEEAEYIHEIIQAGANGYVLKTADSKEIFAAVQAVAAGEQFFSPSVSKLIVAEFLKNARQQKANPPSRPAETRLTEREQELVALIGDGLSNNEIAQRLHISTNTVKSHVHNVLEKLSLRTRLQIANHSHTLRAQASSKHHPDNSLRADD